VRTHASLQPRDFACDHLAAFHRDRQVMSLVTKKFSHERRLKGVIEHVGGDVVQNGLIAGLENSDISAHEVFVEKSKPMPLVRPRWSRRGRRSDER
jgi:hypothetical protein